MLNRFKHIVEELMGLIENQRSASILLTVSGGIDSMCLADMWVRAFGSENCAVAHCNFNLRGEDSDADEALVTEWVEAKGVRLHKVSFDTVQYASENGLSIEMAARELRYTWFGKLCDEHGYAAVMTAHHADDNAETLVLNMVRGTGLKGLSGMKQVSVMPYGQSIPLLRPLLTFTRKQIEGHAFAWKVPYREDRTNASVEYRRNSVRHEIFPLFEKMNPSYVRTLNREMTYFADASDIVEEWCRTSRDKVVTTKGTQIHISTSDLLAVPQWRYLLYYILEPYGFNTATLESLENLLISDRTVSGKQYESEKYILYTERDHLAVCHKIAGHAGNDIHHAGNDIHHAGNDIHHAGNDIHHPGIVIPDLIGDPFVVVRAPGAYHVNGVRFVVEVISWTSDMPLKQPAGTVILDADKLKFPFVCRGWKQGDWFIPFGMRGRKKVSDFFTDMKFGHADKSNALMLVDCTGSRAEEQHIAGILGNRIDEYYKVTEDTVSVIRITITDSI